MEQKISGIHHITAITSNPQQNIDFYAGILGLRFIKQTVNYDDPGAYHFYYGDEAGSPGTALTFFAWPGANKGRVGTSQVSRIAFSIPEGSLEFWKTYLQDHGVTFDDSTVHFEEQRLNFEDPDGLPLELVIQPNDTRSPWQHGPVPPEYAIRGFAGATLAVVRYEQTAKVLTETMGFHFVGQEDERFRFKASGNEASTIDVLRRPAMPFGVVATGTVHHIAWRTPDESEQQVWREHLLKAGLQVTEIIDRQYFHSIYFREPGGVLFEIATDGPGFTIDESIENLGTTLQLPPWYEQYRDQIVKALPPVTVPVIEQVK